MYNFKIEILESEDDDGSMFVLLCKIDGVERKIHIERNHLLDKRGRIIQYRYRVAMNDLDFVASDDEREYLASRLRVILSNKHW